MIWYIQKRKTLPCTIFTLNNGVILNDLCKCFISYAWLIKKLLILQVELYSQVCLIQESAWAKHWFSNDCGTPFSSMTQTGPDFLQSCDIKQYTPLGAPCVWKHSVPGRKIRSKLIWKMYQSSKTNSMLSNEGSVVLQGHKHTYFAHHFITYATNNTHVYMFLQTVIILLNLFVSVSGSRKRFYKV